MLVESALCVYRVYNILRTYIWYISKFHNNMRGIRSKFLGEGAVYGKTKGLITYLYIILAYTEND